jgi:hypothetical protein
MIRPTKEGTRMIIAEPTFIASLNGLCGFILVVEDGVDAFSPSGNFLGVFHDRIAAAEAVLMCDQIGPAATDAPRRDNRP